MFEARKSKSAARVKEPDCVTVNVSQMLHFKILNFVSFFLPDSQSVGQPELVFNNHLKSLVTTSRQRQEFWIKPQ